MLPAALPFGPSISRLIGPIDSSHVRIRFWAVIVSRMRVGNNASDHRQKERSLLLIAATAALCGLLFGYDTGVISGALLFLKKDFALSVFLQGVVTSAVLAGAAAGAGFSGRLTDHFGRRRMVIAVAILFFVASLLTGLAPDVTWLIIGRVLVG